MTSNLNTDVSSNEVTMKITSSGKKKKHDIALWPWKIMVNHLQGSTKIPKTLNTLQWRHNSRDDISNHQPYYFLLNRLFRRRSKKTSKLRVTSLCEGNSPVTDEFPAQRASNAEMFSFGDVIMKWMSILEESSGGIMWGAVKYACLDTCFWH